MTDQTQTTTEPVDSSHGSVYDQLLTLIHDRDHALRGDERTDPNEIDETVLEIMRITTPQPLAIGLDREAVARAVYEAMVWALDHPMDPTGHRVWVEGGNSFAQYEARKAADAILALAAPAEGWKPGDRVRLATGGCATICNVRYGVAMDLDNGEPDLGWAPKNFLETDEADFIERLPAAPTGGRS